MRRLPWIALALLVTTGMSASGLVADDFEVTREGDGVTVREDGKLVTRYLMRSGAKPVLWPVMGPGGVEMTRAYPLRSEAGPHERDDHIHHRSFWFTHGDVNGIDFWAETEGHGNIVHREFTELAGGEHAVIEAIDDWNAPDGTKVCEDRRRFVFGRSGDSWWVDVTLTVTASEGKLVFGDTKEGCFGVRVAGTMKVDEKLGGRILNSEGQTDGEAWGKPARWVDYSGPVGDTTAGITIMNHPTSYGYPSHWHVRTYGLFTANPFGLGMFYGKDSGKDGTLELSQGESFTLRYRVLVHPGDAESLDLEAAFDDYTRE